MSSKAKKRRGRRTATEALVPQELSHTIGSAVPIAAAEPHGASELWTRSRAGARAGRGYHFQDVIGAWLASRVFVGDLEFDQLVPEGFEDIQCEGPDCWHVQIKSRQEYVGFFSAAEVAALLIEVAERQADRRRAGIAGRSVLVVEGYSGLGSLPAWGSTLGEALPEGHPVFDALMSRLSVGTASSDLRETLLREVAFYVLPWSRARTEAARTIGDHLNLPIAAAEPIVSALREEMATHADDNARRSLVTRSALSRTDIERVVVETASLVDRSALEEAITTGVCEPVDFDTPLETADYYAGLDTQPGHIVAGLPVPQPVPTSQIVGALEQATPVLVAGPSGVGKSTVMWAAAFVTRHILWYRVRRLNEQDVEPLVRLARAHRPTSRTPFGLVVDGVGIGANRAWDALLREAVQMPGLVLLGSVRNEDLLSLATLPETAVVSVRLDEEVARSIYDGLVAVGATQAAHWREAFEVAEGLTMEFTHLLTHGRRLDDVVREQVARRVREHRGLELDILALAATAHQWGAGLALAVLESYLQPLRADLTEAIARLQDEHLLCMSEGALVGLHQLRSRSLARAVHSFPPLLLADSAIALVGIIEASQLQPFLTNALIEHPELDAPLVDAAIARLGSTRDPTIWASVLQALRLVDAYRAGQKWIPILEEAGVGRADWSVSVQLAQFAHDMDAGVFKPEIEKAVAGIRDVDRGLVLRDRVVRHFGPGVLGEVLLAVTSARQAMLLLAPLAGSRVDPAEAVREADGSSLDEALATSKIRELGEVMSAARAVSVEFAHALAAAAGGRHAILARVYEECPWVVEVGAVKQAGLYVARGRILFVATEADRDLHDEVVSLAVLLLWLLPECERTDVETLLPGGQPLTVSGGFTPLRKELPRKHAPSPCDVAWNNAQLQAFAIAAGSPSLTERASVARHLVANCFDYLDLLTKTWVISRYRESDLLAVNTSRMNLLERVSDLVLPVGSEPLVAAWADENPGGPQLDHLHTLVSGIARDLSGRLEQQNDLGLLAVYVADTLRSAGRKVAETERWDLLGEEAPAQLAQIDGALTNLHDVLAELAWGDLGPQRVVTEARSGPSGRALSRVGDTARSMAFNRYENERMAFDRMVQESGMEVECISLPVSDAIGVAWPPRRTVVAVAIERVEDWPVVLEECVRQTDAYKILVHNPPVFFVPLFRGRPINHFAMKKLTSLFPASEDASLWAVPLGAPLPTPLADAFIVSHRAVETLSGLAELQTKRPILEVHQHLADEAVARFNQSIDAIAALEPRDGVVEQLEEFLRQLLAKVANEVNDREFEDQVFYASTLSTADAEGASDFPTATNIVAGLLMLAVQWDADPAVANDWLGRLDEEVDDS